MTTLVASTTATAAAATEGDVKALLTNLRAYMADLLGTDSTNKGAALGLLGSLLNGKTDKTGAYTVVAADRGKVINCSGTWSLSITAAATLGDGFSFAVRNSGDGAITIDPNLSETVNGQATYVVGAGEFFVIYCDGATFTFAGGSSVPAGSVIDFAGATAPVGWLFAYGQAISRASYTALFNAIGTTHGVGDGSTTFNLPDLRGRATAGKDDMGGVAASRVTSGGSGIAGATLGAAGGAQTHVLTAAQMPVHTHTVPIAAVTGVSSPVTAARGDAASTTATSSPAGSGAAHNNMPPSMIMNKIIKT